MLRKPLPPESFEDRIRRHVQTIESTNKLSSAQKLIGLCALLSADRLEFECDGVLRYRRSDLLRMLERLQR